MSSSRLHRFIFSSLLDGMWPAEYLPWLSVKDELQPKTVSWINPFFLKLLLVKLFYCRNRSKNLNNCNLFFFWKLLLFFFFYFSHLFATCWYCRTEVSVFCLASCQGYALQSRSHLTASRSMLTTSYLHSTQVSSHAFRQFSQLLTEWLGISLAFKKISKMKLYFCETFASRMWNKSVIN